MKRTLLKDLLKVYCSLQCEKDENNKYKDCSECKNLFMCDMLDGLINTIVYFY